MIKEAIQFLQNQFAGDLAQLEDTDTPVICAPSDMKIQSLEPYMNFRARFRGTFKTDSPHEFAEYVNAHAVKAGCFIQADTMSAETIFDLGDEINPGHCEHIAELKLTKTAEYKALLAIAGSRCSQKELAEWLEDWRDFITAEDDQGESIPLTKAITAVRNITIEAKAKHDSEQGNFSSNRTSMESIEAKAKDAQPATLHFDCTPYNGLQPYSFTLRLSIITEREPKLTLRLVRHETDIQAMGEEFKQILDTCISKDQTTTYLGQFNTAP